MTVEANYCTCKKLHQITLKFHIYKTDQLLWNPCVAVSMGHGIKYLLTALELFSLVSMSSLSSTQPRDTTRTCRKIVVIFYYIVTQW